MNLDGDAHVHELDAFVSLPIGTQQVRSFERPYGVTAHIVNTVGICINGRNSLSKLEVTVIHDRSVQRRQILGNHLNERVGEGRTRHCTPKVNKHIDRGMRYVRLACLNTHAVNRFDTRLLILHT